MNEKGITLLEVILTTVILGLLASVATLSVSHYLTHGKQKIVSADFATIKAAVKLYVLDHNQALPDNPLSDLNSYMREWPVDPFSAAGSGYTIEVRTDPSGMEKVYIGSCGPDGEEDTDDDISQYVN